MEKYESIYDIFSFGSNKAVIKEAEEDSASNDAANDEIEGSIDDDFSIDTSLPDEGSEDGEGEAPAEENPNAQNPDAQEGGEAEAQAADPNAAGGVEAGVGDPNAQQDKEASINSDIFASLTAEEQQIKIKELKNLYSSLYSSCDDILERINKLDINENNLETISRISTSLYDIKVYLSDYMTTIFPTKTYIENDVVFVRFLNIIKSITEILDDIGKKYAKENEEKE